MSEHCKECGTRISEDDTDICANCVQVAEFDRAHDAANKAARLTARPEPQSGEWRLMLATAIADLDSAINRAFSING